MSVGGLEKDPFVKHMCMAHRLWVGGLEEGGGGHTRRSLTLAHRSPS